MCHVDFVAIAYLELVLDCHSYGVIRPEAGDVLLPGIGQERNSPSQEFVARKDFVVRSARYHSFVFARRIARGQYRERDLDFDVKN